VDEEVKRIIDSAYERARKILTAERPRLDRLAEALLEYETLEREDILLVVEGKALPPRTAPVPLDRPAVPPADRPAARALGLPDEAPSPA
jgi:hypothetical protein